jgi:hypothetical protein
VCIGAPTPPGTTGTEGGDTSIEPDASEVGDDGAMSTQGDGGALETTSGVGSDSSADGAALPGSAGTRDGDVGCGCASGPRSASFGLWAGLLALVVHRRALARIRAARAA